MAQEERKRKEFEKKVEQIKPVFKEFALKLIAEMEIELVPIYTLRTFNGDLQLPADIHFVPATENTVKKAKEELEEIKKGKSLLTIEK